MRDRKFLAPAAASVGLIAILLAVAAQAPVRTATLAYVAVAGNNHVLVLDLESGRALRKIYSGATPWRLVPSPDRRRLWVQHWYSGTTAVVDLENHEIAGVLPTRGPGAFTAGGDRFVSFDWPSSSLRSYNPQTLALVQERVTEIPKIYDMAPDPDGSRLYLAQFDPMAEGPRERYAYVVAYPHLERDPARAFPVSYRTGRSPVRMKTVAQGAFLLTADHDTNGLSLVNRLGDGRAIPACPAPQMIALSGDEKQMIVPCWRGMGSPRSQVVSYRTEFGARPWPRVTQQVSQEIAGGVVAAAFSPSGGRVYLVDRTGGRLLECDPATLQPLREFPVGDEPVDVVVLNRPAGDRDRLAAGESRTRTQLRAALSGGNTGSRTWEVLAWTETARWKKAPPSEGTTPGEIAGARALRSYLRAPDSWRTETERGSVRISEQGHTVTVDPSGRFWVTPRQNLIATVLALPLLTPEEAIRRLAGDVPGSPFLRGGLAVDVVREIREGEDRSLLIGASKPGERVAQLWIDLATRRPTNVVEQFPLFETGGHGSTGFGGLLETKLYDFAGAGGLGFPARLERVIDGQWIQEVRIEGLQMRRDLPKEKFDLASLGGLPMPASFPETRDRAVPILNSDYIHHPGQSHGPYNNNPPTSGPRLRSIAAWGVHRIPVPLELQVHNLEHGGVAIQYNCPDGCRDWVRRLEELVRGRDFVLLAPYPWMKTRIALTAWGRLEMLEDLDLERIRRFVGLYAGQDHHAGAETTVAQAR